MDLSKQGRNMDELERIKVLVSVLIQQRNQLMDALAQATVDIQLLQHAMQKQTNEKIKED